MEFPVFRLERNEEKPILPFPVLSPDEGNFRDSNELSPEVFARGGFRRWSPLKTIESLGGNSEALLVDVFRPLRFSGMVGAGRIATGAAFRDLANDSLSAQGSISYGWYDECTFQPWMEVEVGATIDSGIFTGKPGDPLKERFGNVSVRVHPLTFETWNDQLKW
jgi:hypothetical protein